MCCIINIFCCLGRSNRIEPLADPKPNLTLTQLAAQAFQHTAHTSGTENEIKTGHGIKLIETSFVGDNYEHSVSQQGAVEPQKTNILEQGRQSLPGSPTNITYTLTLGKTHKANNYLTGFSKEQEVKRPNHLETEVVEFSSISKQGAVEAHSPNNYNSIFTEPRVQPFRPNKNDMMSRSTTPQDLLPKQKQKRIFHYPTQ